MEKDEKKKTTNKKKDDPSANLFNRMGKAISDAVDYAVTGRDDSEK